MYTLRSEFGQLEELIIHRPGKEVDRLTPENKVELLFEDVPDLMVMQEEHDGFIRTIREVSNTTVFRLGDLLVEVMRNRQLKEATFRSMLATPLDDAVVADSLARMSTAEVSSALIAGLTAQELARKLGSTTGLPEKGFVVRPSPNSYFMRDPAAVCQGGIVRSNMRHVGRREESTLMEMIFTHHPHFAGKVNLIDPSQQAADNYIEGGDVIVLSHKSLAIGCSERTTFGSVKAVAAELLENEEVERVYAVFLPEKRNFMHLDTVFTIIDENLIICYPEAVNAQLKTTIFRKEDKGISQEDVKESILQVLKEEIPHLEVIATADGNLHYAAREQWYDGANLFAVAPRKVVSYNRNRYTNIALKEAGVEVYEIRSSELSRGLGGPRCMTMPVKRKPIWT